MKNSCTKILIIICLLGSTLTSCLTEKEKLSKTMAIKEALKTNNFKFVAQNAQPLRSTFNLVNSVGINSFTLNPLLINNLNGYYDLTIKNDSLLCNLPYFGVVNQLQSYNSNDTGIKINTTDYDLSKTTNDKGIIELTIIPKDTQKANKLFLTINKSGFASLNITFINKDAIRFTGSIEPI
jgi:hypothetical protein